jgi:hypothetical protein
LSNRRHVVEEVARSTRIVQNSFLTGDIGAEKMITFIGS